MGDAKAATAAAANGAGAPVEQVPLTELEELQLQVDNGVHEVSHVSKERRASRSILTGVTSLSRCIIMCVRL